MARYSTGHKAETRRRILGRAGARLKERGIDGSGLSGLMADAGLTNGAFYAHFGSKDDLVAAVVADQLATQRATLAALPPGPEALEAFAADYLSAAHRDAAAEGCPSAALIDEIARGSAAVRRAYTGAAEEILREIASRLDEDGDPERSRRRAVGLYALLVGTVQLERALDDPEVSDEVLRSGLANARTLIRTP